MLRGTFKILSFIITSALVALFLLSLIATYVPAEKSAIISGLGMGMPLLWLIMCACVVFWLVFKKISIALGIILIVGLSYPIWNDTIIIPVNKHTLTDQKEIKIISYNAKIFNFYEDYDAIMEMLERENADIVCLQEFGHYSHVEQNRFKKYNVLKKFREMYPYSHRWYKNQNKRTENGLATFSKYPIINKEKVLYASENNVSILSDIVIGKDTIRLINNHLESNKLSRHQRDIAKGFMDNGMDSETIISSTKSLSETLGKAGNIRTKQAKKIRSYLDNSPYHNIVCGDFNDVPQSYVCHTIKGNDMNSAFAIAGKMGYYWTFHENLMFFPIDHILIDKHFKIKEARVIREKYSDHYPIKAVFYTKGDIK